LFVKNVEALMKKLSIVSLQGIAWSSSGLFSLVVSHQIFLPFPSYPYRWFARRQVKNILGEEFERLVTMERFRHVANEMAVGYVFSTAISLELLIPNSSLYTYIMQRLSKLITTVPLPQLDMEKNLVLCKNDKAFDSLSNNQVGIAVDDSAKGSKYGDIAFTMCTTQKKDYKFRAEVKAYGYVANDENQRKAVCSCLLDECLAFFKRKADYPQIDYVVFVCWFPLLEWVQNKTNNSSGISNPNNSDKEKRLLGFLQKPGYLLVDNVKSLHHTILDINALLRKDLPFLPSQDFTSCEDEITTITNHDDAIIPYEITKENKSNNESENESEKESKKRTYKRRRSKSSPTIHEKKRSKK